MFVFQSRSLQALVLVLSAVIGFLGCDGRSTDDPSLDLASAEASIRANQTGKEHYNTMARVLQLDAAATEALQRAFAERDEAVEAWLGGEKGHRLIALEAELFAGVEAGKLASVKEATGLATPLRDELRGLIEAHEERILGALTPDQRVRWFGYEVARRLLELMEPLALSFQQVQAIEQAGAAAVAHAVQAGEPTPKAAAFMAMESWAEERVLDAAQRDAYQGIKAKHAIRSLGI